MDAKDFQVLQVHLDHLGQDLLLLVKSVHQGHLVFQAFQVIQDFQEKEDRKVTREIHATTA